MLWSIGASAFDEGSIRMIIIAVVKEKQHLLSHFRNFPDQKFSDCCVGSVDGIGWWK